MIQGLILIIFTISIGFFVVGFYIERDDKKSVFFFIILLLILIALLALSVIMITSEFEPKHNHDKGIVVDKYQAHEELNKRYYKVYYIDVYYDDCKETISYKLNYYAWNALQIDSEFILIE